MSFCVGLTGGIASGKSTVSGLFLDQGVPVVDADQAARDVVVPGSEGLEAVIAHFGKSFLSDDGTLNRHMMREAVFSAPEKRAILEGILHPLIRQALQDWRNNLTTAYGILMAPIMREGGFDKMTDRMLVVDVPRETQKQRLMQRDGINATLAEQMLDAQSSRSERLALADDVIDNSAAPQALQSQVAQLHHCYLKLAQN